jgi:CrcB protein
MNRYLAVMLGGAFGSVIRYTIGVAVMSRWTGSFPIATFLINVTGSFLIGVAMTLIPEHGTPYLRPLVVTGVLGGYTTFSSFEWETFTSSPSTAVLYVLASVIVGFLACWCGASLARMAT